MTDFAAATIHQYTLVEIEDSIGNFVELLSVEQIEINNNDSIPFCSMVGADDAEIQQGRKLRIS